MSAWLWLIILWIAIISLFLHDATKIIAKAAAALLGRTAQKLRRQTTPIVVEQTPAQPPTKPWWRKDVRVSITAAELELAIAQAVKAEPGCEDFIGVLVQPKTPKSRLDPNWEVRGVRFGKANRITANEPLAMVVTRFQQEFRVAGDNHAAPRDPS